MVEGWKAHDDWIVGIKKPQGESQLISAAAKGEVLWWDLRAGKEFSRLNAYSNGLVALDVHNELPISLVAGTDSTVKIYGVSTGAKAPREGVKLVSHLHPWSRSNQFASDALNSFWNSGGHATGRSSVPPTTLGPSAIAWHPRRLLCAIGSSDGSIALYSSRKDRVPY